MREIKFRAFGNGEMIFFDLNHGIDSGYIYDGDQSMFMDDGAIVMQFTGLFDKNGKEIYEGDILHDPRCPQWFNWLIEYHEGSVCLVNIGVDGYRHQPTILSQFSARERVVIGNIYENPELLKQ